MVVVSLIRFALQLSNVDNRQKVVYRGHRVSILVPLEYKEGALGVEDFQQVNWSRPGGMASSS